MTSSTRRSLPATGDTPGTVVTFYSYKGGVGRSFLLANVAALLAKWGWRVLCIDWDLEAPGLHRYFEPLLEQAECWDEDGGRRKFVAPGVVDLVESVGRGEAVDWRSPLLDCGTRLGSPKDKSGGSLHLLPAGAVDVAGYGKRTAGLDWRALFSRHALGTWIDAARRDWSFDYDLVLVDSRTGITDAGALATVLLPDFLVATFTANAQSLYGVSEAVRGIQEQHQGLPLDRRGLRVLPVASRFDARSEIELAKEWGRKFLAETRDFFEAWVDEDVPLERLLPELRIGHFPRWSFGEALPVLREPTDNRELVSYVFANVAALLARSLARADELVSARDAYVRAARPRRIAEGLRSGRFEHDVFVSHGREDREYAVALSKELNGRGVRAWLAEDQLTGGESLLRSIDRALSSSEHMMLLWRDGSSAWQWTEMSAFFNLALADTERRLIPVRLGDSPTPPLLGDLRSIDASRWSPAQLADYAAREVVAREPVTANSERIPVDPVVAYRDHLVEAHSRLVPFVPQVSDLMLRDVVVEVDVEQSSGSSRGRMPSDDAGKHGQTSLRDLVEASVERTAAGRRMPRWLVLGEPGSGKTTTARNLVRILAEKEGGALPVYTSVTRLDAHDWDLAKLAATDVSLDRDARGRLVARLREQLGERASVWIVLDGFDEVPGALRQRAWRGVEQLGREHPKAVVLVLSRPVAFERRRAWRGFRLARIRALDARRQSELVGKLVGDDVGGAILEASEQHPRLSELARNPFLLTLLAFVGRDALAEGRDVPSDAPRLLSEAVELLLGRGFALQPAGVKDERAARDLLQALSLELHRRGGEAWWRNELSGVLWDIRQGEDEDLSDASKLDFRLARTWETNDAFLDDVAFNAGILGLHDGPGERWRFLHRALREFLAAERLARLPEDRGEVLLDAWIEERTARPDEQADTWAEVWQLYLGLTNASAARIRELVKVSKEVGLRALRTQEHVAADDRLKILLDADEVEEWDLLRAARSHPDPDRAQELLWERVVPEADANRLGLLDWTLEGIGLPPVPEALFEQARPDLSSPPELEWAEIPGGTFLMGSAESEPDRYGDESPQHAVLVPAFMLAVTPVTNEQYRRFAPKHVGEGRHPVTNVSWWEARLYARWLGARLPSEAEWEYACRARTTTPWWTGAELNKEQANFDARGTRPVDAYARNPWGLYDMHGNVWEWCEDTWSHDYSESGKAHPKAYEREGAEIRVRRGGSFRAPAGVARSAYRSDWHPGARYVDLGFRLARVIT